MSSNSIKFNYDADEDVLFIYNSEKKSRGSIEYGKNLHISFSPKNEISGLEILNATEMFQSIFGLKITKENLSSIAKCNLWDEKSKGLRVIKFSCVLKDSKVEQKLIIQDIDYKSPILATAR